MKKSLYTKIGMISFLFWGVIHVLGGAVLLQAVLSGGASAFLNNFIAVGTVSSPTAEAIFAFHSFNILWIGLVVGLLAITTKVRAFTTGYWATVALAGFSDLGLILFMLLPGYISWMEGSIGISLFVVGVIFSSIGGNSRA